MISIINIGMNHESAPVEFRECLAKDPENASYALDVIRDSDHLREGFFLSTCNRVEVFCICDDPESARQVLVDMLSRLSNIPEENLIPNLYFFQGIEAVKHIFRVAASLDSMIVGEPQILGQIKDAYRQTVSESHTSGVVLNRLMHRAFHVAKRVKTETGISQAAVSISYAAVELAKKIFYDLKDKKILLIGAGEMAELAATHLISNGITSLTVANRSFERALNVAEKFNGKAVLWEEIETSLLEGDIVITSTASTEYVVVYDTLKGLLKKRRNRPIFFIDIAVPRDVDPKINDLGNVYLYDIDDLKDIVEENSEQRRQEAVKAERIIAEEVIRFGNWLQTLEIVPTIAALKEKAESIRKTEIQKSLSSLGDLTPSQIEAIEILTLSLTDKILNDPVLVLKQKAGSTSKENYLDITRELFNLDKEMDN